jgi:hypothetical protein
MVTKLQKAAVTSVQTPPQKETNVPREIPPMVIDKKLAYMQATRDILLLNPAGSFNCFLNVVV